MKRKINYVFVTITILSVIFSMNVFARDNTALSVATESNGINTWETANDAATYYDQAGYLSFLGSDLTKNELYSYLYADVQFFAAHGAYNNIAFKTTGIIKGDDFHYDGKIYIGTNTVHWDADTKLVTYLACETAKDSSWDTISGATCNKGADTVLGFNEKINVNSATPWAKRYNQKLKEGSNVYDAAVYASSFMYLFPSVKNSSIYGNAYLTIGGTNATSLNISDASDSRDIIYDIDRDNKNINLNEAVNIIQNRTRGISQENFEVVKTRGTTVMRNQDSIDDTNEEYVDLMIKIGEFYTEEGYTVYLKNGIVQKIYNNVTTDLNQIQGVIESNTNYNTISEERTIDLRKDAINQTILKYSNLELEVNYDDTETKLFYDLKENKKYLAVEVKSTVDNDDVDAVSYDTVFYEI